MKRIICNPYIVAICLLLLTAPLSLKAQQSFPLKGIVAKAKTNERVAQVRIVNLKTQQVRQSDDYGQFNISVSVGDTIEFSKSGYTTLKQAIVNTDATVIYLEPTLMLNPVVIKGTSTKQDQQAALEDYQRRGVYNNGKSSVLSSIASPLNALHDLLGKDAKQARRFAADMKTENEYRYIDKRFSKPLITQITGLKDDELDDFIVQYRPTYDEALKWSDYDIITYIKTAYASYSGSKKSSAKDDLKTP